MSATTNDLYNKNMKDAKSIQLNNMTDREVLVQVLSQMDANNDKLTDVVTRVMALEEKIDDMRAATVSQSQLSAIISERNAKIDSCNQSIRELQTKVAKHDDFINRQVIINDAREHGVEGTVKRKAIELSATVIMAVIVAALLGGTFYAIDNGVKNNARFEKLEKLIK